MSDISIPGLSSKYNTSKLVEDLVAAERIRLTRMEENIDELKDTKKIWRDLTRQLGDLQRAAKGLYGFDNPFSEKSASSSNERILTAQASRTAPMDNFKIMVKQTASSDRFLSSSLPRKFRVEKGLYSFQVGDKIVSLKYRGGTLEDFSRKLSDKGEGLLRASTVRDTTKTQVLMIEAIPTGDINRLSFLDDSHNLGVSLGMMRPIEAEVQNISFSGITAGDGSPLSSSRISLEEGTLTAGPSSSLLIPVNPPYVPKEGRGGMVLEYQIRAVPREALLAPPPAEPQWPAVPQGTFADVTINSSPSRFALPDAGETGPPPRVEDPHVLSVRGGGRDVPLPRIELNETFQNFRVPLETLGPSLEAVVLDNKNTYQAVEIKNIRIHNPDQRGGLEPVNPVDTARDSIIEFRGITARRPSNSITDLIDGLTLNLKRSSTETVDLAVEPDTETAKDGIIKFVYNYNQLLTKILILSSSDAGIIDELEYVTEEERTQAEDMLGVMRGEVTLSQIKNRLQTLTISPYTTRSGKDLALLAQIGISTNAAGGGFSGSIDFGKLRGYLEIDEEKLDLALSTKIDSIKDLFGKDLDGDLIIDSGVGWGTDTYLNPHTRTGGFMAGKMARLDNQITDVEDDIQDYEKHLEDYEADLKRQYGMMEAAINEMERSSQSLDNFNNQQGNKR